MAFDFLDQRFRPDDTPTVSLLGSKRFVAQFYQPPTSPRSTIMLYQPDNLVPASPAGDRYRSSDEPPAFEMSFVFPKESTLRLTDDPRLNKLSESSLAEAETAAAKVTASLDSQLASEDVELNLRAVAHDVRALNDKIKKTNKRKVKKALRKERATLINNFKMSLGNEGFQVTPVSGQVFVDTRDPKQLEIVKQWANLKGVEGLQVRHFKRSDRTAEEQAVAERERAEGAYQARREIAAALSQLESIPALTFTVPPESLSIKFQKILFDGNLTQQGYQVEMWGEALDQVSVSGRTGAFYTVIGDTGIGGLNNQLRRGSRAYQELMALVGLYRNNGFLYHTLGGNAGQVNVPAALIKIQFGQHTFIGRFNEFSMSEEDSQPFSLSYQFTFTSFVTSLHGADSGTETATSQFRAGATPYVIDGNDRSIEEDTL